MNRSHFKLILNCKIIFSVVQQVLFLAASLWRKVPDCSKR